MKYYAYKAFGTEQVKEFSSKKERDDFIKSTKCSDGTTEWEPLPASKAHTKYFEDCVKHA